MAEKSAPMYLEQVLKDIKEESAPPKSLHAEHLFKLNEAVFNLNEDDTVDTAMATKIFQIIEKVRKAYNAGTYDNTDSNFFYDYLALLGTMQNQHFFSTKQTEKMLDWIREVMGDESLGGTVSNDGAKAKDKKLEALQAENADLKARIRSMEADAKGKGKSQGKKAEPPSGKGGKKGMYYDDYYEDDMYEEPPLRKGKGRGRGKGKAEPEPPSKGKGKGDKGYDAKGKGKEMMKGGPPSSKGKDSSKGMGKEGKGKDAKGSKGKDTKASKGSGKDSKKGEDPKGKGKKGKSKYDDDSDDEPPPLRESKGKGKGKDKGKSKGKWKARG